MLEQKQDKVQKYSCGDCGTSIPSILNESTGLIEPQTRVCPKCTSTSMVLTIEEKKEDNRQILYG